MRALVVATAVALLGAGCWVDSGPSRRYDPPPAASSPGTGDTCTPASTADPPRIPIDPDRTLHASPGQGAGVFITYASGGTWTVEWTCDTNVSGGRTCDYELAVNTTGLVDVATDPANAIISRDKTAFSVRTQTGATLDSATFHTEPGSPITFSMRLGCKAYPDLVWYVSNGVLTQAPTDPIELVPAKP
jgi:hypothetical protein